MEIKIDDIEIIMVSDIKVNSYGRGHQLDIVIYTNLGSRIELTLISGDERMLERLKPELESEQNSKKLSEIEAAIAEYYAQLERREHGGVAQDQAFWKIEQIIKTHQDVKNDT